MAESQAISIVNLDRRGCDFRKRKRRPHCKCISTDKPPKRPDPAIYSQIQRISQGIYASWESPDIKTNWWIPWRFMDSIEVIVQNKSNEASAVNTLVQVSWAPFGIGTIFAPLGAQMINLGLAPDQKIMQFPVSNAIRELGNNVSIRVDISHPHDKDAHNNLGFQAIHGVVTSDVGKAPKMDFAVVNDSAASETITLVVQANEIGASVSPASKVFAPNEQITATLSTAIPASITPPSGGHILKEATVIGYNSSGKILGGVTLLVRIDS